jgi:hypothetical protein
MTETKKFYVASRASVPARGAMWRAFRDQGVQITSSWIDEDGEGQTQSFTDLWNRIAQEIAAADRLVLYAESDDFPLKGALIEAGIALGMNKPVIVCLPAVDLHPRSFRPIGSWIAHPLVTRNDEIHSAVEALLDCPMCNAPKSFMIDLVDPAVGYCAEEDKRWRVTSTKCATEKCFKPKAPFGDHCMACLENRVNAEVSQ